MEYEWIRPGHLDLPYLPDDFVPLIDKASSVFTDMAFEQLPSQKAAYLKVIWKMVEVFFSALADLSRQSSSPDPIPSSPNPKSPAKQKSLASMDDMFPILLYILVKSHPPQLLSDLAYISACCRDMTQFGSFIAFQVANTQMGLEFIRNLTLEKLSPLKEQSLKPLPLASLQQSLRGLVDSELPTANGEVTPTKPKLAKQSALAGILNMKDRLTSAVGRVADSVNGTVSLVSSISSIGSMTARIKSSSSPATNASTSSPIAEASTRAEATTNTVSNTDATAATKGSLSTAPTDGKSAIPMDWTLLDQNNSSQLSQDAYFISRYPFFDKSPSEISSAELKQLLQEYRALAVFHYQQTK